MNRIITHLPTIIVATFAMLLSWIPAADANVGICISDYDPSTSYPPVPASTPYLSDLPVLTIYVDEHRALVELDGCLYTLGEDPFELDLGPFDELLLSFVFADLIGVTTLLLSTDAGLTQLEPRGGHLQYTATQPVDLFLLFGEGPQAPTVPLIVRKPIEPEQEPS